MSKVLWQMKLSPDQGVIRNKSSDEIQVKSGSIPLMKSRYNQDPFLRLNPGKSRIWTSNEIKL